MSAVTTLRGAELRDVIVSKSCDCEWRKFVVMPLDNRTTEFFKTLALALARAGDLARSSGGKTILRLKGGAS